jgi:hypothetical protein
MLGISGIAVFFVVGLLVSLRLLGLARRTRRMPELLAGLGLLGIGPLGFCVLMAGIILFRGTAFGSVLRISGLGLQALGFVASAIFTCRVFRPGADWARALATAIGATVLVTFFICAVRPTHAGGMLPHQHLDAWIKILCLGWGAIESLHYWRVTRKRVELGIADPLVSASFLLWGIALASGALGFLLIYAALLTLQPGELLGERTQLLISACGLVTAAGLYLAFLPPKAYARRLAARAPARTAPV